MHSRYSGTFNRRHFQGRNAPSLKVHAPYKRSSHTFNDSSRRSARVAKYPLNAPFLKAVTNRRFHFTRRGKAPREILKPALASRTSTEIYTPIGQKPSQTKIDDFYIAKLSGYIHEHLGIDFRGYKKNTLRRRIEKRLSILGLTDPKIFLSAVKENIAELQKLRDEFLIGVTDFYRDVDVFEALEKDIIPEIIKDFAPFEYLRIWVPGCSTGEEAYSIATLLENYMQENKSKFDYKIFASDIDNHALNIARRGIYRNLNGPLKESMLAKKYFIPYGKDYKIHPGIRKKIVFSNHNVISDPPYSRMHLISLRNVLIYVNQDIQHQIIDKITFSLLNHGYLVLGNAEHLIYRVTNYRVIDNHLKIFQKTGGNNYFDYAREFTKSTIPDIPMNENSHNGFSEKNLQQMADKFLLEHVVPLSILVNKTGDILYIRGRTGKFFENRTGIPSTNIFKMAREGLLIHLSSGLRKAAADNITIKKDDISIVEEEDNTLHVMMEILPVEDEALGKNDKLFMITLKEAPDKYTPSPSSGNKVDELRYKELEDELFQTREELQYTIEDLKTSNEELKSSSEEVMSAYEELQSTNEELETSREELNTTNAELNTVNYELQKRIKELSRLNNDLNNFIESTDIPTLFVDLNGNIHRFTPNIDRVINLTESDIHRNIKHFKTRLLDVDLEKIIQEDMKGRRKSEKPVLSEDGSIFLMKIIPYLTENKTYDGIVITFTDITELETLTDEIKQKEKKYQDLFTYINEGFLAAKIVYDKSSNIVNFEIEEINQFFLNLLNIPVEQAIGKKFKPFFEHYVPEFTANCIEVIESNKLEGIIRYSSPLNKYLEFSVFRSGDDKIGVLTRDVTDTITYQKALKRNKNLLERAQQIARFGYMIYHTDTRKIEWSNETYHIFERDPILGPVGFDKQKEHVHEDDWPVFTRAIKKALDRGLPFNIEFRIHAGGRIKYLQSRAEIEKNEAGHTEMIICTLLDITKLKEVQETLRISKNNYADLFNSMIDGFATHEIITDELGEPVDYRFLKVNPAFEKITGLKNSEVRGKRLLEILPETDLSWIQKYGKVALEGTSLEFEDYHEDTGKFFNVHAYSPQKGQFAVIFEDITIRKKIENELKKSEAKYRGLFELIPAGISITDHQGNIIEANKASEQLLDLKRDKQKERHIVDKEWEIIGSDLQPFPPDEFASTRALKENRTITNVEMGIVKDNGRVTWINVSATPIAIKDIGVVIIYTDITDRKKYESEILLAKEKAEQADKLKTVFLANMSHEIRTPLNAIIGFSDILEKNNVDNTSRQTYLHIIRERGYHLLNIINDLIDFSKIEAGQLELTNRATNLNQLMRENHEIFKLEIFNKQKENINISFTYGLLDNKACILTDEYRLKEVIGNLLSNAIKFTTEGTIEFGYAIDNDMLKFHVKDSGIGIPAEELKNVFQRFVQVDNTLTREYGGTGLGLAICKGIVEKMGGEIWVESTPGKGTAFYFTIPYLPCTDKLENTTGSTKYNELPAYDFKKLNVLVVEDDEPSYLFINELLEKTSARNTHAEDVNKAIEELKENTFDIVLLDLHLPGKSGFELLDWMKKSGIDTPVLIQSADVMESTREKCRSLGCSDFIAKPLELHQLMSKIEYLTGAKA